MTVPRPFQYLILGTWYREPFCHQMGPYQTLRAENWSTQLLVRFRVFFEFKKSRNHLNGTNNFRDVFCLKNTGSSSTVWPSWAEGLHRPLTGGSAASLRTWFARACSTHSGALLAVGGNSPLPLLIRGRAGHPRAHR